MATPATPSDESALPSPERILSAAEKLFADNGFASVSLRKVTAAAGVNLAAVHYHFGSKDGLIEAVLRRNIQPINEERIRLLDAAESDSDGPLAPEVILEAFLKPTIEMHTGRDGQPHRLMQLYGRVHAEPDNRVHDIFFEMFTTVSARFGAAFRRSLTHLTPEEIAWRMHFVIGTMAQSCAEPERVKVLSHGAIEPNATNTLQEIIPFLAAGLRAPGRAAGTDKRDGKRGSAPTRRSGGKP